jgi:uncharacterized tellurite resistance protein B-like protein/uncharacterized protein YaaW (UPF0174 family)
MSSILDELQGKSKSDEPPIIDSPLQFKAKLNIGDEAYAYLSKADNMVDFSITLSAGVGGGALASVAWFATLGPFAKLAMLFGVTSTPVGWFVGAGALTSVLAYGLMKAKDKKKDKTLISIPKHLNTPLDLLGQMVISLILPATVKMALADGNFCEKERKVLREYLAQEWGFNRYFIANSMAEQETLINDFNYEEYRQILIASTSTHKEIKYDVVKSEIISIIFEIMNADGNISPEEKIEFERLSQIINEQGDAEAENIADMVSVSLKKKKQILVDFFSSKVDSIKKTTDDDVYSEDLLFDRLKRLNKDDIKSLLVSGLRVSDTKIANLNRDELIALCSSELRSAAGSSCRGFFRNKHEFPYKQILIDVADRLADGFTPLSWTTFKLGDSHAEYEIEETILNVFDERARKWWEKLPEKKKSEFVNNLQTTLEGENIDKVIRSGGVKTLLTQQVIENTIQYGVTLGLTKFAAPGLSGLLGASIVGHIGWLIIVQTLGFMTGIKIAILGIGGIGAWGGAVSFLGTTVVGGALSIPSTLLVLDGAAYRKTIPTVIMLLTMCRAKNDSTVTSN